MGFESFCILELKKKLQEVSFKSGFLMDNLNVALTWRWEDLTLTSRWYSWGLFHLILGYQYEQNDKYNSGKLPSRTHIVFSTIWGNTSEANQKPICRWRNNREIRWPDQGHRAGSQWTRLECRGLMLQVLCTAHCYPASHSTKKKSRDTWN